MGEGRAFVEHDNLGDEFDVGEGFSAALVPHGNPGAAIANLEWPMQASRDANYLFVRDAKNSAWRPIPLAAIHHVEIKEYSHGKTAGLAVGITLGSAAVVGAILTAVFFATFHIGGPGGGGGF